MSSHVTADRLQSALTVTFRYLFPILTMGLALFIAWFKTVSARSVNARCGGLWFGPVGLPFVDAWT